MDRSSIVKLMCKNYVIDVLRRERTDWHQVVVYSDPLANLVETALRKGSRVYVEGQLLNRKWKDQKGEERQTI
jgi:single-strand DNA-binding protein